MNIIDRISGFITAEDIMTEVKDLKRADHIDNAKLLFNEYDVVPYPKNGSIQGYFHRAMDCCQKIERQQLISNKTDLLTASYSFEVQVPKL